MQAKFKTLSFVCKKDQAEVISDWLTEQEALSVTLKNSDEEEIFSEELNQMPLWKNTLVQVIFSEEVNLENIKQQLHADYAIEKNLFYEEEIADDDWEKSFRQYFKPQCFADKLWVYPAWEKAIEKPHIILEPGLAFGTGTHPTTQLCLTYLAQQDLSNKTVIDYGCGSGILAIAAAKLGAKKVYAVDHDLQALQATQANAGLNHVEKNKIEIILPQNLPAIEVDIVISNILANILTELKQVFLTHLKKGGDCILSGIMLAQMDQIKQIYFSYFTDSQSYTEKEWVMLLFNNKI